MRVADHNGFTNGSPLNHLHITDLLIGDQCITEAIKACDRVITTDHHQLMGPVGIRPIQFKFSIWRSTKEDVADRLNTMAAIIVVGLQTMNWGFGVEQLISAILDLHTPAIALQV